MTEVRSTEPWHVTVQPDWPPPTPPERAWQPRTDLTTAALMAVLLALFAPLVGLLWAHLSPELSVTQVLSGSEVPFKAEIGDDVWFLFLAGLAGALTGAVACTVGGRGPGVVLGLVFGGLGAAAVAARVGFLAQRAHLLGQMRSHGVNPLYYGALEFKLRALGVVTAWPIAAVAVFMIVTAFRDDHR